MPFRRKHRNPLFGSSRPHADKENAQDEVAAMERGPLLQPKIPLISLPRCHSDTSQRTCSDVNPNTLKRSNSQTKHRHGEISTKESNLQLLNSTLIKEVSSLRASHQTMAQEKEELENEVGHLATATKDAAEKLDATEDRLNSLGLVVKNLENMNGALVEEATRLREDTDRYAEEKQALLADLDKVMVEKSLLEELLGSIRASGEAFREEMQQALLQADMEKKTLSAENEALRLEKQELQIDRGKMVADIAKFGSDMSALLLQKAELTTDKLNLEGEFSAIVVAKQELAEQLLAKQQALASAQENLVQEKVKMLSEKTELELSMLRVRDDQKEEIRQLEVENQEIQDAVESLKSKVEELQMQNKKVSKERDAGINEASALRAELQQREKAAMDAQKQFDLSLEALVKEKDNLVSMIGIEMEEARSSASKRDEEAMALKEQLDEASKQREALEAIVKSGTQRQSCMEKQIRTLEGDLLVAEDAASGAQKKAREIEKEAAIAMERRTRETYQEIGALESKLAAMVERQGDMEAALKAKEEAMKAAVRAEKEAREKLDAAWVKGSSVGGMLEQLRVECKEIQSRAMRGTQKIALLQAEVAELGGGVVDRASSAAGGRRRRQGRRERSKAGRSNVNQAEVHQPKV